jgi:hypothetical protein
VQALYTLNLLGTNKKCWTVFMFIGLTFDQKNVAVCSLCLSPYQIAHASLHTFINYSYHTENEVAAILLFYILYKLA